MNLEQEKEKRVQEIERVIAGYMPECTGYQKTLIDAMQYSIQAGGKRLRPMLMQEAFRIFGGSGQAVEPFMAALEMIHTYSLVHDDLPAMDNDEYRRGRLTTHMVYGEAMAVLAGDGLLTYAFETAVKAYQYASADRFARALSILAEKAGIFGMAGGQGLDVEAEKKSIPLTEEQLLFIHEKKTAALIQAALMIGAVLAGASDEDVSRMERIGYYTGVAFQIQDDILDVTGTSEELGKPVGSDEKNHKETYVTLHGLEESIRDVEAMSMEAVGILNGICGDTEFLRACIMQMISRRK